MEQNFSEFFKLKLQQLISDLCIFVSKVLIIAIYVDDIIIVGREI